MNANATLTPPRSSRRMARVGAAAVTALFIAVGCGTQATPAPASATAPSPAGSAASVPSVPSQSAPGGGSSATPKQGGQVVMCKGFAGPGMDPIVANDIEVWAMFDPLVQIDMTLHARPALAQSWEVSSDGKTYTFHINPTAKWSDGQPVTAQDVVFTFDKVADTKINAVNRGTFGPLKSWTATDDHTVVFALDQPALPFIWAIGQQRIAPKHVLAGLSADEINTGTFNRVPTVTGGPWKYVKGTLDGDLVLGRNDAYYMAQGSNDYRFTPYLDTLIFRVVPDTNTVLLKLRGHECDTWSLTVDEGTFRTLKQIPDLTVSQTPVGITTRLMVNLTNPLFSDTNVRVAMASAIDRTNIVKQLLPDVANLADTEIDSSLPGYDPTAKGYPYDAAKAKTLLAAAGWTPGSDGILVKAGLRFSFTCVVPTGYPEAQVIQQNLKAVGIDMQEKTGDWAQLLTTRYTSDFVCNYTDPGWDNFPDRRFRWLSSLAPPNGQNYAHYSNPAMDQALNAAYSAPTLEAAIPYYQQVQQILAKDVPDIPTYHAVMTISTDSRMQGFDVGPIYYTDTACKWWVSQ